MRELVDKLNHYTEMYDKGKPEISDREYDELYFKLVKMEEDAGYHLPDSPTHNIIYEVKNELQKVEHNHPMLSADKTKVWDTFKSYFGDKKSLCMLKLDGLTCSLRYVNGKLVSAETRGNGVIGEDVTHNALVIKSIPKFIDKEEELIIDGEVICTAADFEPFSEEYANSRNFASGSIRLLDNKECEKRNLTFVAWNVVKGFRYNSFYERLSTLEGLGFKVVPWTNSFTETGKNFLLEEAEKLGYPIDGLVGRFDDVEYGESLGSTEHHSRALYAFKFYDEEYETILRDIEWTLGRTGLLTPVAVFDPVDADGSVLERASLHNVSVMYDTLYTPFYNQSIKIYKANAIIPQICWAEDALPESEFSIPEICPVCGGSTKVKDNDGVKTLWCDNPNCEGKLITKIDHYCSKKGLEIKGLSRATLEKLVDWGWLNNVKDIYELSKWKSAWTAKSGFGDASVNKILGAIEDSKNCNLEKFICGLGIPLIGSKASKEICKVYDSWNDFRSAIGGKWSDLDGFGPEMEYALNHFDYTEADEIAEMLTFKQLESSSKEATAADLPFKDKIFVITGRLQVIQNREKLINIIEKNGGKVVNSVNSKTSVLINNDINSNSTKNRKAKELNIPVITEEELLKILDK